MKTPVWIIGAGKMGHEYARTLKAIGRPFQVFGRGEENAVALESALDITVARGGLASQLHSFEPPDYAIVATQISELVPAVELLIDLGVRNLLVEKPVALYSQEVVQILEKCRAMGAKVSVAYNRRFYPSVSKAMELLEADGGLKSMRFDFTEFAQQSNAIGGWKEVLERWVIANSSHVLDLAFFIAGRPTLIDCWTSGSTDWHPGGAVFSGHGLGSRGIPFSYIADWSSVGRWSVEMRSRSLRLVLGPLENLYEVDWLLGDRSLIESVASEPPGLKPGLYQMLDAFLSGHSSALCTLQEHSEMMSVYEEIAGYSASSLDLK